MIDELLVALRDAANRLHLVLSRPVIRGARQLRAGAIPLPRSGVVRRVGRPLARRGGKTVARPQSNGAGDGSGQPGIHPSQPQGGGSAGCSDRRRLRTIPSTPRRDHLPVRRSTGLRVVRRSSTTRDRALPHLLRHLTRSTFRELTVRHQYPNVLPSRSTAVRAAHGTDPVGAERQLCVSGLATQAARVCVRHRGLVVLADI